MSGVALSNSYKRALTNLDEVRERLATGAAALGLPLADTQLRALARYLELLEKWNKTYNLTAIRDRDGMIVQHLFDSLAIVPALQRPAPGGACYLPQGARLLDVGTGAGLPGLPVAIARPDLSVTLLDGNQKKTAFVRQAIAEVELKNAQVANARVEVWRSTAPFQVIVSRAYAELALFVEGAQHLLAPGGCFAAMKGQYPADEIARLPGGFRVLESIRLDVPELDAERHLIVIAAP